MADILGETPNITTSRQAGVGVGWGYVVVPVSQDDSSGKRAPRSALTLCEQLSVVPAHVPP